MNISLEALIPQNVRGQGADVERRARAVVVSGGIVSAVSLYIAWVQYTQASRLIGVVALVLSVFGAVGAEFARRTGRWEPVGIGICAAIFIAAALIIGVTGGALPAASFYLGLVPVAATIFFGARPGAIVVAVNIVYLTSIESLRRNNFDFTFWIPDEVIAQSDYRGAMTFEVILFVLAVLYDMLRRASLNDVADSEARYAALCSQNTELVFELDSEGVIRHVAEEHAAALGWTAAEVIGRRASEFLHAEDQPDVRPRIETAVREGRSSADDIRILDREGTWHWYAPSLTSFQAGDRELRVMVIAHSLDSRLDAELQQRQSQKMDAVGQLASGVAHDFNNLLMVVGSYAQMLTEDLPPGDQHDAAHEILQAAEQGEALTRQLLAVGRPSSHSPEQTDANEIIRRAERILTKIAGDRVSVEFSLQADLLPVIADAGCIDQILVNLTVNARDAMPDGGALRIRTAGGGERVLIQVTDTGVGIAREARDRIFEAFFTTKSRQQGTGLGLYIVYTLVREMGGTIDVDSELRRGTTMTISLPAARELAASVPAKLSPARKVVGGTETILLVEDRTQLRDLVEHTLKKAGYLIIVASNGQQGLDRARSHDGPIDLVLSDVVMPGMNGPEMARILREEFKKTRFLFMSGHPERAREVAEELSEDRLITKPIGPPELLRRVRGTLDRAIAQTLN